MKSLLTKAITAISVIGTSAQTTPIQFNTNMTWNSVLTAGQVVPVTWTVGNSLPVSLLIKNATWSSQIFVGRAVSPTTYMWTVGATAATTTTTTISNFVSGNYSLTISQVNGGTSNSPDFYVSVPGTSTTAMTGPTGTATATGAVTVTTVTYMYWDDECGCTKTGWTTTTAAPMATTTTSWWWDDMCGCHLSTVVPIATLLPATATNNYSVPAVTTHPATTTMTPVVASSTAKPSVFVGEAAGDRLLGQGFCSLSAVFGLLLALMLAA